MKHNRSVRAVTIIAALCSACSDPSAPPDHSHQASEVVSDANAGWLTAAPAGFWEYSGDYPVGALTTPNEVISTLASTPQPVRVIISGRFRDGTPALPGISAGSDFKLSFVTDLNPEPAQVQLGGESFIVYVSAAYAIGESKYVLPSLWTGYFHYELGYTYAGVDLRTADWVGSGRSIQIIFVFSTPGYTGPASSPTLELLDMPTWGVFIVGPDPNTYVYFEEGHYQVIPVNFTTTRAEIERLLAEHLISNPGVGNMLVQRLAAAEHAPSSDAAEAILRAMISTITVQSGKGVTSAVAADLAELLELLITTL